MKKAFVLLVALVIIFGFAGCGKKESVSRPKDEYVITCVHASADTTSQQAGSLLFKEEAEKNSGGRIKVNIYPNAQLGGDRETIEGTQAGQITMMSSSGAPQVNFVPDAVIFDLPFVYPDIQVARKTLTNPDFINAISASYAKSGLRYLGASDQGFRTLTANKEVHSPADVQGMTIRTMENKYHMAAWKAIGANPTPLAFNELYTALQQKVVDAQENPIELIYSQKFYEQQKYTILTNHIFQTIVWIMNADFYNKLPDDLKKVVDDASAKAIDGAKAFQDTNVAKFEKVIKDYGCTFVTLTPEQLSQFEQKAKTSWDLIKASVNPGVYDAFMTALGKAR